MYAAKTRLCTRCHKISCVRVAHLSHDRASNCIRNQPACHRALHSNLALRSSSSSPLHRPVSSHPCIRTDGCCVIDVMSLHELLVERMACRIHEAAHKATAETAAGDRPTSQEKRQQHRHTAHVNMHELDLLAQHRRGQLRTGADMGTIITPGTSLLTTGACSKHNCA